MNDKSTLILALIGSFAWLPQIITWIYSFLAKPKLKFVPEETVEIGYTSLGPIFNQFFAISTSVKDALIERVKVEIIHETGEKHEFVWKFLDERGPEFQSITGEKAEWRKNQPAIALKVSVLGLTEKKIGFQDYEFQKDFSELFSKGSEKESYLLKVNPTNFKEEALKSQEHMNLQDFIKDKFYWKQGRYKVVLSANIAELKEPHTEYFAFELTKPNIQTLEINISEIQNSIKDYINYRDQEKAKWPQRRYNWINPQIYRITRKEALTNS
jgi:hypothetical protein